MSVPEQVKEKLSFALDVEDGWPPVATESIWCEKTQDGHRLCNIPFFIEGLALGDVFQAEPDPANGCIFDFLLVDESGHSVVWILDQQGNGSLLELKKRLVASGCSSEAFPQFNLHALDVPAEVPPLTINALLDEIEAAGYPVACPVWRHEMAADK